MTSRARPGEVDHDLSRLNGTIRVSPGAARFATSDVFGKLLKLANLRETGLVGQKLNPLDVTVRDGVMSYPRYKLPLGEFTIETEGSVNLANRTMDVVTYVPAGAVADETIGLFRITNKLGEILGPASPNLDRLVMLPFRTKGSLDGASTSPDLELFAKETIKTINPVNIIEEGAGRLGDIFKKKPQQEPPPK